MSGTSQPVKPFLGVRFVLRGFDSINESKIRTKLIDGGGVDSVQCNPSCTHVIVDKIVYDDPLCVIARKDCKTVVTGLWVDHSYDIGMPVDFTSIMYRPPKDLNGIPGAKGLVVCLTGYQRQDRDDIMTLVSLMGAQFSKPLVANKVTHLICYKFEGEKYELGKKLSTIKLVNHRWLEDCLKEWEILPETNYNKSGFELEIMEAEAKDSEEEAEDTSLKQSAMENIPRSPYSSKPSPPQLHRSPKLKADLVDGPAIASNPKDKFPVQSIDNRSGQSLSFENISISKASGFNGGLTVSNPATHCEFAEPQYQSPFRKHAKNDLTPKSQRTEITPPSDGRFSGASYSRKTKRSLKDLPSNHSAFGMDAPKVDDPSSSFDKLGDSKTFESPKSGYNSISVEKSTVYSPMQNVLTESYGTPIQQRTGDGVKPCIGKSPSPSEKIHGLSTSFFDNLHATDINLGSIGNNELPNTANHEMNSRSTNVTMLESVELSDQNEKSAPQCFKRLKKSSMGFADLEKLYGEDSKRQGDDVKEPQRQGDDVKEPQNQLSYVKGSAAPEEDGNSKTKPLRKKMVAKKTLGSRSKIVPEANKKGSLFLDKRTTAQNEAVSEKPAQSFSCEAAKTNETEDGSKSKENALWPTAETVNDETETPEGRIEQVLVKVADQVNFSAVELAEKSETVKESEIVSTSPCPVDPKAGYQEDGNISPPVEPKSEKNKIVSASSCPEDRKPGNQEDANISAPAEPKSKENKIVRASAFPVDPEPGNQEDANISAPVEPKSKGVGLKRNRAKEKAPAVGKNRAKKVDVTEGVESKEPVDSGKSGNEEINVVKDEKKKTVKYPVTKSKCGQVSMGKSEKSLEEEKENTPVETEGKAKDKAKEDNSKKKFVTSDIKAPFNVKQNSKKIIPKSSGTIGTVANAVREEPVMFILSGHRLQRKEFQKVIRRLKGKFCRDSHQWSYQATHFIVPDPIRRTEKFFAAAASGRWILKTDYLAASNEAGKFVDEESYEWHKNGLNEDGAINLEAPRKWRLLRQRTGHGAFHGMRIIIYGECIAPSLDTLKRVVKAGDGMILATSPPYTRFLDSGVDFAVVSPGMPRVDAWVQEFLSHEVPCVVADYLVEYVCKPGYSLEKHSLYNTHSWAQRSFARLQAMAEETVVDPHLEVDRSARSPAGLGSESDVACRVCGSRNREEVMLICGDESGSSGCGVGCHIDCCEPPMEEVPEGDWFCSECTVQRNTTIAEKVSSKKRKKCSSLKKK